MTTSTLDVLSMSDDEFSKLPVPSETSDNTEPTPAPAEEPAAVETPKDEEEVETPAASGPDQENTQTTVETPADAEKSEPEPTSEDKTPEEPKPELPKADVQGEKEKPVPEPKPKPEDKQPDQKAPEDKPEQTDYKAFFEKVMAPFKANGKLVQLQSVDEVIQLMQMGANYTKKMQSIQQHKKYLMMLENNGLLDESKLSFLIDIDKKNPEAIKKLLKDGNIDPVDVDTSGEVNYKSGSHAVSDQEAHLATAIDDLNSTPGGKETLQSVHSWDPASKKALWDNPELLAVIHSQRENGIYDRICTEMERRKMVGQINPNMPFLQAYKAIGDELAARGAFGSVAKPASPAQQPMATRTPVAVRPAKTPVTKVADAKVRAAAPPRSAARPAQAFVNVLAMSDEEFTKFANKV